MPFARDDVSREEVIDIGPHRNNLSNELMSDSHRHPDGLLRPIVPIVDMNIGATDARVAHPNQHVVNTGRRLWNLFQPEAPLRLALDQCFH